MNNIARARAFAGIYGISDVRRGGVDSRYFRTAIADIIFYKKILFDVKERKTNIGTKSQQQKKY